MQEIPIQAIPSQTVSVSLAGQSVQVSIYQKAQGVFVDVTSDGIVAAIGTIARDAVALVCQDYKGFAGNLMFLDTQGSSDPDYTGVNTRFMLVYLTAAEYALI